MKRSKEAPRWSVHARLAAIEGMAYWRGELNRSDVVRRFGVSLQQASADIKHFMRANPRALRYDRRTKRYLASGSMTRKFTGGGLDDGMSFIEPLGGAGETAVRLVMPTRHAAPSVVRDLVRAVARNVRIKIHYASLRSASLRWRVISPHAFGFDGYRWHVRAWCYDDRMFKDFVLGRICATEPTAQPGANALADRDWFEFEEVILKPARGLNSAQRHALASDFEMKGGRLRLRVRRAMRIYLLAQMGVADGAYPIRFQLADGSAH